MSSKQSNVKKTAQITRNFIFVSPFPLSFNFVPITDIFTIHYSSRVYGNGSVGVRVSACLFVGALAADLFDIRS